MDTLKYVTSANNTEVAIVLTSIGSDILRYVLSVYYIDGFNHSYGELFGSTDHAIGFLNSKTSYNFNNLVHTDINYKMLSDIICR